jgi:hypothetical protein
MTAPKDFTIAGRHLCFAKSPQIEFPLEICEVVTVQDILIVLLKVPYMVEMKENVFGVKDGAIIWYVEPRVSLHGKYDSYSGLATDGVRVTLYGVDGVDVDVDYQTGRILGSQLTKYTYESQPRTYSCHQNPDQIYGGTPR